MRFGGLASAIVAITSSLAVAGSAVAQPLRDVTYALPSTSLIAAPPRIAEELGLFLKHGIHPKFTYIDSTSGTATALLSKSVDFAVTGTSEVIAAEARGQHLVILASHYMGLAGSLVLSKTLVAKLSLPSDAPVSERLKALNGVIIASTSKVSSFTIAYKGLANSVGAEPRFAYMAVGAMGAALQAGVVDGIIVTAPYWAYPIIKGDGVLWLSPPRGDLSAEFMPSSASVTATTRDFASANPDLVKNVISVFDELSAAFAEQPTKVKAAIAKLFPDLEPATLDLIFSLESKSFQTKPLTPEDIMHDITFMKLSGLTLGPIDSVNPSATLARH